MNDNNRWVWTLIQGILAIGLGVWTLIGRESALTAFIYASAVYVAVAGLIQTVRSLLNRGLEDSTTELIRGLIGLIGGAAVLVLAYFTTTTMPTILTILGIVLIAYGAVGLFSTLFARGGREFLWQPVLVNALLVLLGVLVFVDRIQEIDVLLWASIIFIAAGAVMVLYALTRQRGHTEVTAAV